MKISMSLQGDQFY